MLDQRSPCWYRNYTIWDKKTLLSFAFKIKNLRLVVRYFAFILMRR